MAETAYDFVMGVEAGSRESAAARKGREAISRIKEVGFRTYVEELEKEKLEELRKEILQAMGYSEADLEKMSAGQRAQIEKLVDEEIRRRLAANSLANKGEADDPGVPGFGRETKLAASVDISQRLGLALLDTGSQLIGQEEPDQNSVGREKRESLFS